VKTVLKLDIGLQKKWYFKFF